MTDSNLCNIHREDSMKRLVYGCGCCIIEQDICETKEIGDVSKAG